MIPNIQENALITAVKQLSEEEILFFVNNGEPGLWIYNMTIDAYSKVEVEIEAGLEEIVVLDRKNMWIILSYIGCDQDEKSTIDWIDLNSRKLIVRLKENISNLVMGWENNYFISEKISDEPMKKFWFKYLVKKSSLIMELLMKTGVMSRFGSAMCRKVIQFIN